MSGLLVGAASAYAVVFVEPPEPDPFTHAYDREFWDDRIRSIGAADAYAEFKRTFATSTDTHTAAHFIGDRIYASAGAAGLSACDASFGYGCFHQVAMRAVENIGSDISTLEEVCSSSADSSVVCVHGLGHGLAEVNRTDVGRALAVCEQFSLPLDESCARGVFMEHLVPLMVRTGAATARSAPDARTPHAPCMIGVPFQASCFFSLPQWWLASKTPVADVIAWCGGVPAEFAEDCFSGIGISLPGILGYDRAAIERACDTIATKDGRLACMQESERTLSSLGKP